MRWLLVALLCAPLPVAAQMYKCVNARGAIQYSDKPCPGDMKGGEVDIKPQPPISGKVTPYKEDLKRSEREFQQRELRRVREEESAARARAAEQRRCDSLREQLARTAAIRRPGNAEAHEAALRRLTEQVEKCR